MKASWECQRWWVALLSRIKISVLVAAAVAKMLAGREEITFVRVAEILGGRTKRTDAMLLMVEALRVTTLLATGARVGGGTTALPLVRMDVHAHAKEEEEVVGLCVGGCGGGKDVGWARRDYLREGGRDSWWTHQENQCHVIDG